MEVDIIHTIYPSLVPENLKKWKEDHPKANIKETELRIASNREVLLTILYDNKLEL